MSALGKTNSGAITPMMVYGWPSSVMEPPRTSGSDPRRPSQKRWVTTATGSAPSHVSSPVKVRPSAAETPSVRKKSPSTSRMRITSGRSPPVSVRQRPAFAPQDSKVRVLWLQSLKFGMESEIEKPEGAMTSGTKRSSGSLTGRGSRSTALATLKIAVLAAIPSAMVNAATMAKPGRLSRVRIENRRSFRNVSTLIGRVEPGRGCNDLDQRAFALGYEACVRLMPVSLRIQLAISSTERAVVSRCGIPYRSKSASACLSS